MGHGRLVPPEAGSASRWGLAAGFGPARGVRWPEAWRAMGAATPPVRCPVCGKGGWQPSDLRPGPVAVPARPPAWVRGTTRGGPVVRAVWSNARQSARLETGRGADRRWRFCCEGETRRVWRDAACPTCLGL